MAELLAGVDIGEVHLDRGQPGDLQRVADRPRVVRPRPRVEHDPVGVVGRLVELLDELALVVALEEVAREVELAAELRDPLLELGEGEPAVVLGGPAVERPEVDAVQDGHAVLHRISPPNADRTSPSETGAPVRTSPGASTRTKPTRPPRRFLSRCTAASTAS